MITRKQNMKVSEMANSIRPCRKYGVIRTISAIGNSFTSNKFLQSSRWVQHLLATIQIRLALHPSSPETLGR